MFTGITTHTGSLVTAIVMLTGAAILRGGTAAADSNQDDQFLALLDGEGIPALEGVPSLIDTAHRVCRALDGGMSADGLVDAMVNNAYGIDPNERLYAPGRLARTEARFITAAVEAYCPYDQGKIASIMANPAPAAWHEPTGTGTVRLAHLTDGGVFVVGRWGDDQPDRNENGTVLASLIGAIPEGVTPPSPPQIPAPPPARTLAPPRPIAAPPPPKQQPPPPKQPPSPPKQPPPPPQQPPPPPQQQPPPPQQVEPPAVGPQPGGAAGSGGGGIGGGGIGGGGGNGGGGIGGGRPAEPSPPQPMPPGFVRLAP